MLVFTIVVVAVAAGGCAYFYVKNKNLKAVSEARSRMDSVDDMSSGDATKRMRDGRY
tara:strand:+ start:8640 stop:8810 length:171 start_codon:yes stop_codon:yes gene_type:complete